MTGVSRSFRRLAVAVLVAGTAGLVPAAAHAEQDYPSRTIRIIVPFGGGSGSDASARYFADRMAPLLGQPIIVENRPGAAGAIGMSSAKLAPADGYTIVQGGISPSVVNAVLVKDLPYDPLKDFVPLLGYGRNMNVLVVPNEFDEPTAGMSVDEVPVILGLIRELRQDRSKTILLVEHKMDVVRELSDRIIVLHNGRLAADGAPAEVIASPVVQQAYLGMAAEDEDAPEAVQ